MILAHLPPYTEQHRIATEVERWLSVVQELEAAVEANLKRAERLRQAILKRAFEGRLVPQDPADEPAGVLLARIRAERQGKYHSHGRCPIVPGVGSCYNSPVDSGCVTDAAVYGKSESILEVR